MNLVRLVNSSPTKKILFGNFISLSFLQGVEYLLPMITIPYLLRIIGVEKFGFLMFVTAFVMYFQMLVDYGFNYSAMREISVNRENKNKVMRIFSAVMLSKLLLFVASFIIFAVIVFSIDSFAKNYMTFLFAFGTIFGNMLIPSWLFQGLEKLKHSALLNIFAKSSYTMLVFILVKSPTDYLYVPLINSLCLTGTGILALLIVVKHLKIPFVRPDFSEIKQELANGKHISLSIISMNIYAQTRTVLLGLFTGNTTVGYYAVAEKVAGFFQVFPFGSLLNVIMPRVSLLYVKDRERSLRIMKKLQLVAAAYFLIIFAIVFIFADAVIVSISGVPSKEASTILRILAVAFYFAALATLRFQYFISKGDYKTFSIAHAISGIIGILLTIFFGWQYGLEGVGYVFVAVAAGVFATSFVLQNDHTVK